MPEDGVRAIDAQAVAGFEHPAGQRGRVAKQCLVGVVECEARVVYEDGTVGLEAAGAPIAKLEWTVRIDREGRAAQCADRRVDQAVARQRVSDIVQEDSVGGLKRAGRCSVAQGGGSTSSVSFGKLIVIIKCEHKCLNNGSLRHSFTNLAIRCEEII